MQYQTISVVTDDRGIATLKLNRPQKHNAMSSEMMAEITDAARKLNADREIRGVVLTGEGKSFCAGADLGWMRDNFERDREQRIKESEKLSVMLETLNNLDKPLIARVNGQAYAGGIGLISVCDIAVGVRESRFSVTEARLGLIPANISWYLLKRIGIKNARRSFLNAHFFDGKEAVKIGLLDKAVEMRDLDATVETEIRELLDCAPGAVAMTKKLIRFVDAREQSEIKDHTATLLADCWEGDEAQGGIQAFFDKQAMPWTTKK